MSEKLHHHERIVSLTCPTCGKTASHVLTLDEDGPCLALLRCPSTGKGCGRPFAAEVSVQVIVDGRTCRLAFPSAEVGEAVEEAVPMPKPPDDTAF